MKKDVHPKYGPVLFKDITSGDSWIGRSTKLDGPVEVVNGVECHVVSLEISSFSHPFYSGKSSFVDTAGRVERFKKRFGASTVISKKKAKAGAGESA